MCGIVRFSKGSADMLTKLLLVQMASIIALIISGVLAFNGTDGWGWFLFVAVVMYAPEPITRIVGTKG